MRPNRCDCCGGKFGLVLQRLWTRRFCSRLCKRVYQADRCRPRWNAPACSFDLVKPATQG